MKDTDLAWLAGLLEGEGCFYLGWRKTRKGEARPVATIVLTMTDKDVVQRAADLMETTIFGGKTRGNQIKAPWTCSVTRNNETNRISRLLRPYMGERRQAKIDQILEATDGWVSQTGIQGHGTRACFIRGCRQPECVKASSDYHANRKRKNDRTG